MVHFITKNADPSLKLDLVIIDYRMPKMNGIDAAKIIRAFDPEIKIILASAYDVPSDAGQNFFDAVLKKPFSGKKLVDTIQAVA